jgi:DNA polymerase-1
LATININVPVDIDIEQLRAKSKDVNKLKELFNELEFRSLSNRILSTDNSSTIQQGVLFPAKPSTAEIEKDNTLKTISDTPHKYQLCEDDDSVRNLVEMLLEFKEVCFDTETTGLNVYKSHLVGISFAVKTNEAWFIPFPNDLLKTQQRLELLRPVFEKSDIRFIGQNIKFYIHILTKYGLKIRGPLFDTMIAHYLIQPELKHSMDYLSELYLHYKPISIGELIGRKGKEQRNMRDVELEKIGEYAAEDADITKQLADILIVELNKHNLLSLAENVEMPLIKVLAEMEQTGVKINVSELKKFEGILNQEIEYVQEEIFLLAGMKFNISSPKQLGEVLFEHMKISADIKKTKSGQYPTGEEILLSLKNENVIINKILDYRSLQKLLNTYVETLPELVNPTTGRIHTSFEQAWVSTGRLSSKNPNLQNIPIRDQRGREIRKAFIPADENHIFLSADYSQIELRIMAHLCKDKNMIEAFSRNIDIHTSTAANIYSIPVSDVTREMRTKAKTANFGIIYGISSFGLSQRLSISRKESAKLIEDYFNTYPNVKNYMNRSIQWARDKGYVETIMGRRRFLPDIHSANSLIRGMAERNAINAPIQGSAADIIKLAMVNIFAKMNGKFKSKMILQVHDELLFDVFKPELDSVKEIVKNEMENAIILDVPLIVEIGCGKNWMEAH